MMICGDISQHAHGVYNVYRIIDVTWSVIEWISRVFPTHHVQYIKHEITERVSDTIPRRQSEFSTQGLSKESIYE